MLLHRIMEREDAQRFLNDLLDNHLPKSKDKGDDPIYVRSYVVQHHWRRRWVRKTSRKRKAREGFELDNAR